MISMLAALDPWRWQPHPEVWVLVGGIFLLGGYATRVIGPKVVPAGTPVVTRRQKGWFALALGLLWIAGDWPLHDIGEQYLYSAHMIQHLLISFVVAPLFLLATPEWLARLVILDNGFVSTWIRRLARPIPAAVLFNALTVFLHWQGAVTRSVESAPFHYTMHVLLFSTALLMWVPVAGPLPELRLSLPAQMIYLFLQSVIPTIPGGWLTFAENPVYKVYDRPDRLWDISVITDQQSAGAIMKICGGFYLWVLITILFFRWASQHEVLARRMDEDRPRARDERLDVIPLAELTLESGLGDLTYESVAAEFERLGPAPHEPVPGTSRSEGPLGPGTSPRDEPPAN
jgi:putative membrane protein